MIDLCSYSDILGKPRIGVHAYRVLDFAIVDILLTILGSYFFSKLFMTKFWKTLLGMFFLGIFLHWLFCVNTKLNLLLGFKKM